jgi:hypothetical protein
MHLQEKLARLGILVQDVKAYDDDKSEKALVIVEGIVECLKQIELQPFTVIPHGGGISLIFIDAYHYRYATIEVLNEGVVITILLAGTYYECITLKQLTEIPSLVEKISTFIGK